MKYLIKNIRQSAIYSLVLLFSMACSDNDVEIHQLYGVYDYNKENYIDTIQLLKDSSYIHTHQTTNGTIYRNEGTWKFDSKLREVVFDDFIFYNEQGGDVPGFWIPKVKNVENEIRLIYASEENLYYRKPKDD